MRDPDQIKAYKIGELMSEHHILKNILLASSSNKVIQLRLDLLNAVLNEVRELEHELSVQSSEQ